MSLSEKLQDLHVEVGAAIERAVSALRQDLTERLRSSNEDLVRRLDSFTPELPPSLFAQEGFAHFERSAGSRARQGAFTDLRDHLAAIDRERSQADILRALLTAACHHASRAALFLTRADGVKGWGSEGFGEGGPALQSLTLTAAAGGSWEKLAAGHGPVYLTAAEAAELSSRLEVPLPKTAVLIPLVLRDRVAAALYADGQDEGVPSLESLQILAYVAAQAIETLPFRERGATPTLGANAGGAALGFWPPAAEAQSVEPSRAVPTPAEAAPPSPPDAVAEPVSTPAPPPAPSMEMEEAELPEMPAFEAASVEEPAPVSARQAAFEAPEPEIPAYPSYPRPVADEAPPTASQNATVLMPRPSFAAGEPIAPAPPATFATPSPYLEPPAAPAPLSPAATGTFEEPAAPAPAAIPGTAEVRPPTDVDGPGWAFSTTRVPVSPDQEAMHEEARRLARLLVSEIKLYNEEQVEEGRRNRDIYERLKEDIDRSRQMYEERVDDRIRRSTDYFYQELVRILAAGDSRALGI